MSYKHLAEALLLGKPFFGAALRARQGIPERHQYFLPVVSCFPRSRARLAVLEIGSWAGASAITWALALREAGRQGNVTCVDPWQPYFELDKESDPHYREMNAAAEGGLIRRLFDHNIRAAGVAELVEARQGASRDVLPDLADASFDIIYIDGSHRFEEVRFDIREAKRLLREGGIICGDDLELTASALSESELREALASNRDYVTAADGHGYHPGVTAAIGEEFAAVGVWDGFWAVRGSGDQWEPPALDLTSLHMPGHLEESAQMSRLLESTENYNLVEAGGTYFAVAKAVGEVDLFEELLGDRALPPVLFLGDSLEAVRSEVEALTPRATRATPVLIGSYRGFNLVAYEGRTYALRQSLGPVDVSVGEVELRHRLGPSDFLAAGDVELIRIRIDVIATGEELAALRTELAAARSEGVSKPAVQEVIEAGLQAGNEKLDGLAQGLRTRASHEELTAAVHAISERLDAMEFELQKRPMEEDLVAAARAGSERLRVVEAQLGTLASRGEVVAAVKAGSERLQAVEAQLETLASRDEVAAAMHAAHRRLEALAEALRAEVKASQESEVASIRAAAQDLRSGLEALSQGHRLLARQVSLLQYGPGDPNKPCVAGEYRGFTLVHYQGRAYGLPKPLDPAGFPWDRHEIDNDDSEAVAGYSLDGVRARIDVLEDARELHGELAALSQEFLAADSRLTEDLREVNLALQSHAQELERLARNWPNRVLGRLSR